jgi:hypothetical protein
LRDRAAASHAAADRIEAPAGAAQAGFVEATVDAQRRLYRLKPEALQEVDAWLALFREFWSARVDALRALPRPHGAIHTNEKEAKES